MSQFDDREQAFENQFGHDGELEFKIAGRAALIFGHWAAEQLGLKGAEAEAYAKQAVEIEIAKTGRADLIAKTEKDFLTKQLSFSHHRLEKEMEACYSKARGQIAETGKRARE
jgi:hypothetical protein